MLPQRRATPRSRRPVRLELWVPELRGLPPGQQGAVLQAEHGYMGLDTYDVLGQHVVSHHFRFGEGARPGCSAPATVTSGRPNST